MFDLTGKVAVVTGAGDGLGREISLALARAGASVLAVDHLPELAEATACDIREAGCEAEGFAVDVRDRAGIGYMARAAVEALGGLDICVICAPAAHHSNMLTLLEEEWDLLVAGSLKAMVATTQACAREMVRLGTGGRIILVAPAGHRGGGMSAVTAAAMEAMTRWWAEDLQPFDITVNALAPALPGTRGGRGGGNEEGSGHPDAGSAACWLAGDAARDISGACHRFNSDLTDLDRLAHGTEGAAYREFVREARATASGEAILAELDHLADESRARYAPVLLPERRWKRPEY
ncbi:MAG: SDR family NAD(P)-dependent oxidoreductase [Chloroflexi bacterium]|nr:SDR family NAD(P)-dependent oxidoreductase [Chloroflexota bacterium]